MGERERKRKKKRKKYSISGTNKVKKNHFAIVATVVKNTHCLGGLQTGSESSNVTPVRRVFTRHPLDVQFY